MTHATAEGDEGPPASGAPRRWPRRAVLVAAGAATAAGVARVLVGDDRGDRARTAPPSTASDRTTGPNPTATTGPAPPPADLDLSDFGARGDGRDDTASVVAALRAAVALSHERNDGRGDGKPEAAVVLRVPAGRFRTPTLPTVDVTAPLALRGERGAVLDATGAEPERTVLRATASIDLEGLELRGGGRWVDLSDLTGDHGLLRVVGCTFREVRTPVHAWAGGGPVLHGPDRLEVDGNTVAGNGGRHGDPPTSGFFLALHRWGSASVSRNTITDVHQQGIRLGHQDDGGRPYDDRPDVTCSGNVVRNVWGEDKANGIMVQASHMVISGNTVVDVSSGDGGPVGVGDTEGIYVKGHHVEIRGNALRDAGRVQAQVTVKADDAVVVDNEITFVRSRSGNAIRVEGRRDEVRDNTVVDPPAGHDVISVQADEADDVVVVAGNTIRGGTPQRGIVVDRRAEVEVRGNRLEGLDTDGPLILVRTSGEGPIHRARIADNDLVASPRAVGAKVVAKRGPSGTVEGVAVVGNRFTDLARAVELDAYDGGEIDRAEVRANTYDDVADRDELADARSLAAG